MSIKEGSFEGKYLTVTDAGSVMETDLLWGFEQVGGLKIAGGFFSNTAVGRCVFLGIRNTVLRSTSDSFQFIV